MSDDFWDDAVAIHLAAEQRVFDHLCTNGKLFMGIKRPKGFRQMRRKDCFRNTQSLAVEGRATYVEGLCLGRAVGIAFAHGWLTLDGEHAIDVTLPDAESCAYFGIAFDDNVALAKAISKSGYYESRLGLSSTMPVPPQLAEAVLQFRGATD